MPHKEDKIDGRSLLSLLEDQLTLFEEQRRCSVECDEEEEDEAEVLKFFSGTFHLLWWTLSSSFKYADNDLRYLIANAHVPVSGIDDFLCLKRFELSEDILEMLQQMLDGYENESVTFEDEVIDTIEEIRHGIRKFLTTAAGGDTNTAHAIERGCYLYSCMIATAYSIRDQKTVHLWRQCYRIKITEMHELLTNGLIAKTDYPLMIPFTTREILFNEVYLRMEEILTERIAADKRIFDASNDHTNVESDFKCPKCGSFRTRQYWLQMRSADEPMSCLWKCYACNKSDIER